MLSFLASRENRKMRLDKLTTKSQEALQQAQGLAEKRNHQAIDVEHLLFALLGQKEGVVVALLQKLGVPLGTLVERLQKALDRLPQVTGASRPNLHHAALEESDRKRRDRGRSAQGRIRLHRASAARDGSRQRRSGQSPQRARRLPREASARAGRAFAARSGSPTRIRKKSIRLWKNMAAT